MLDIRMKFIESLLESLRFERKEYEGTVNLANKMLKFQRFIPVIFMLVGFCYNGLINSSDFIGASLYGGCLGFVWSIPIKLVTYLYWGIVKRKYNIKISYIDANIENTLMMKKELEDEMLKQIKMKLESSSVKHDIEFTKEIKEDDTFEKEKTKQKVKKLDFKNRK